MGLGRRSGSEMVHPSFRQWLPNRCQSQQQVLGCLELLHRRWNTVAAMGLHWQHGTAVQTQSVVLNAASIYGSRVLLEIRFVLVFEWKETVIQPSFCLSESHNSKSFSPLQRLAYPLTQFLLSLLCKALSVGTPSGRQCSTLRVNHCAKCCKLEL
jgi:hypothetical protein